MTSIDKLIKAFEVLKPHTTNEDSSESRASDLKEVSRKEKLLNLNIIYENITSVNVKQTEEFVRLLSHAIELYIAFVDDEDQDVCFMAEECLNKTIKSLLDSNLGRIQVELCRFIKKNGTERCFRAALTRFAELSHLIRPQKCRHFAEFLLKENIIKKIANRPEESIQNVLIDVMIKLSSALGYCLTESEIKIFIDSFIPNLSNQSSVNTHRRVAGSCLSTICFYSRNPLTSYDILFKELLKLISPLDQNLNKFSIWGVIICFRNIITHISEIVKIKQSNKSTDNSDIFNQASITKIYEICLYFLDSNDSSVIIASLECLQVLIKYLPFEFDVVLFSQSIQRNCDDDDENTSKQENECGTNILIHQFVRLIAHKFLLDGKRNVLKSDTTVKVLVKSLALECITNAISLSPDLICLPLNKDTNDDDSQYLYDCLLYIKHSDEKLKMNTCILYGNLINSILLQYNGSYLKWFKKIRNLYNASDLRLESIVDTLVDILKNNASNLCKRSALNALQIFVPALLNSRHAPIALDLILASFHLKYSTYNLVKCELVEFLASLDYKIVFYIEQQQQKQGHFNKNDIQYRVINDIFIYLMCSEDHKIRLHIARMFTLLVENLCSNENSLQNILIAKMQSFLSNTNTIIVNSTQFTNKNNYLEPFKTLLISYTNNTAQNINLQIKINIGHVLPLLMNMLIEAIDKYQIIGVLECLESLFRVYEPAVYVKNDCINDLLTLILQFFNHPHVALDLYVQDILLKLSGSLFCASVWKYLCKIDSSCSNNTSKPWGLLMNNEFLVTCADKLLTHSLRLLCIMSCAIDESSLPSLLTSNLNIPSNTFNASLITSTLTSVTKTSSPVTASVTPVLTKTKNNENQENISQTKTSKSNESHLNINSKTNSAYIGAFQNFAIYVKMYELIKQSYNSYKKTINVGVYDKFCQLLKSILKLLSQLLESALSTNEVAKCLDEILLYLKIVFNVDSINTVKCVTQLLKSLFGSNFTNTYLNTLFTNALSLKAKNATLYLNSPLNSSHRKNSIFTNLLKTTTVEFNNYMNQNGVFKNDYHFMTSHSSRQTFIENEKQYSSQTNDSSGNTKSSHLGSLMNFIRKKSSYETNQKSVVKLDSKLISQYIRSFETIVVKSLRQYTTTSSVCLQYNTLELLNELMSLKVNYSLLDSEQVFVDFVLKQCDYLEQNYWSDDKSIINYYDLSFNEDFEMLFTQTDLVNLIDIDSRLNRLFSNNEINHKQHEHMRFFALVPKMIDFFIYLSNEHMQLKQAINIPRLIQICDNLLASENSPHTHAIPALYALVTSLYLNTRIKQDNKDFELQQDVLIVTLLRLINYPIIWHLLAIILKNKQENNEDKWKKLSFQIFDTLFLALKTNQLKFDEFDGFRVNVSTTNSRMYSPFIESIKCLIQLFNALAPQVFRPIDVIITSLLQIVKSNELLNDTNINNWLAICLMHIYVLLTYSNEELILARLQDLIPDATHTDTYDNEMTSSALHFARLLFDILHTTLDYMQAHMRFNSCNYLKDFSKTSHLNSYMAKFKLLNTTYNLLSNYMFFLIYIMNSGYFKKLSNSLLFFVNNKSTETNDDSLIGQMNKIIARKVSRVYPLLSFFWQYFLVSCNYNDTTYWSLILTHNKQNQESSTDTSGYLTDLDYSLNEKMFKVVSLITYCDQLTSSQSQTDNTTGLTMLLINNVIDLFELSNESSIIDLISKIHRSPSASSLFLHSVNSNWCSIIKAQKLDIMYSCLKSMEGLHLSVSGHVINFLIDKYFNLPYLSLVRYADYIACQRIEMMHLLSIQELNTQMNDENIKKLNRFFDEFEYSYRHSRLLSLIKQLEKRLTENEVKDENEKSTKCFTEGLIEELNKSKSLTKELYYEIIKKALFNEANDSIKTKRFDTTAVKAKNYAITLTKLDYNSILSLLNTGKQNRLPILKQSLIIGAYLSHKTYMSQQEDTKPENYTHALWIAASKRLFEVIANITGLLTNFTSTFNTTLCETKIIEILAKFDLQEHILQLTEVINVYMKILHKYPHLCQTDDTLNVNDDIVTFLVFQFSAVWYNSIQKQQILSLHLLRESLLGIFYLFEYDKLQKIFVQRNNYVKVLSTIIEHFYDLIVGYFFKNSDKNLIFSAKSSINYADNVKDTSFSNSLFDTLLCLRYILTNHSINSSTSDVNTKNSHSLYSSKSTSNQTHYYLQYGSKYFRHKITFSMRDLVDKIYISIARLPIVSRFLRISDTLWHVGFRLEYSDLLKDDSALPVIDHLKELQILKEYLNHILNVGWCKRAQFEYEYVNMLTLLHSLSKSDGLPLEEAKEQNKCKCFLIKGLSTWLIKSTLTPESGCSLNSQYEFVSRNKNPIFLSNQIEDQYLSLRNFIEKLTQNNLFKDTYFENFVKFENVKKSAISIFDRNHERIIVVDKLLNPTSQFYFTQINIEGLINSMDFTNVNISRFESSVKIMNSVYDSTSTATTTQTDTKVNIVKSPNRQNTSVKRSFIVKNLDLTSVLRTVLDFYETIFQTGSIGVKYDIFKSMVYLSNTLFDSKQQFESIFSKIQTDFNWLAYLIQDNTSQTQVPLPNFNEAVDDSLIGLTFYSELLSQCCLQITNGVTSNDDLERLNKLFDNGVRSNSLVTKLASIHGLFYWLEAVSLDYLTNTNSIKQFVDTVTKQVYLMKDFSFYVTSNSIYISTLWSSVFYILENCLDLIKDAHSFVSLFIKLTNDILCDPNTPNYIFYQFCYGLERLLLANTIPSSEINTIQKIFLQKQPDEQRTIHLIALQFTSFFSSDYLKNQFMITENSQSSDNIFLQDEQATQQFKYAQILELNSQPELQTTLLKVLEVATRFFDKIKTCITPKESCTYAFTLPYILCNFLPPNDILNKLITEFLNSSHHSHPEIMAYVLYKSFNLLQSKGLQKQIQEWCLLSLSNFVQRTNIYESIWLVSCFLLSVSTNQWVKQLFFIVVNRCGMYEEYDKLIFFIAVLDFQHGLNDTEKALHVFKIFDAVKKNGLPYDELVLLLQSN